MSQPTTRQTLDQLIDVPQARNALKYFRVMAFIVGIGLLLLVAEVFLHYGWLGFKSDALEWWPQPHGIIYIIYIATVANLGFKMRWGLGKMVGVILAGVVPFLSFVVEHKVSAGVMRDLAQIEERRASALG